MRVFLFRVLFVKKFLLGLLLCFCVDAKVSEGGVVQDLQSEIFSEKSKQPEELQKVLEKYFNEGCKIVVNDEEIVLKKEHFDQYSKIGALILPKINKDCKLEILENNLNENLKKNKRSNLRVFLKISEKQKIKLGLVIENQKISEVSCEDVSLNLKQKVMLKGIFNLFQKFR